MEDLSDVSPQGHMWASVDEITMPQHQPHLRNGFCYMAQTASQRERLSSEDVLTVAGHDTECDDVFHISQQTFLHACARIYTTCSMCCMHTNMLSNVASQLCSSCTLGTGDPQPVCLDAALELQCCSMFTRSPHLLHLSNTMIDFKAPRPGKRGAFAGWNLTSTTCLPHPSEWCCSQCKRQRLSFSHTSGWQLCCAPQGG